jgi:hypothetical protein
MVVETQDQVETALPGSPAGRRLISQLSRMEEGRVRYYRIRVRSTHHILKNATCGLPHLSGTWCDVHSPCGACHSLIFSVMRKVFSFNVFLLLAFLFTYALYFRFGKGGSGRGAELTFI